MALQTLARVGNPAQSPTAVTVPLEARIGLAGHIRGKYENAKQAKQIITERLLRCERQRRGEYDPDQLIKIKKTGGSEVYLMLTDIKCRAAESWIKDVILSAGEKPYKFEPTAVPSIPQELQYTIIESVTQRVVAAQQQGTTITPEMVEQAVTEMHREIGALIKEAAEKAAEAMSLNVEDILQEAKFQRVMSDIIYDFVTFPACVIKGPVIRRKKTMAWGANWTPMVSEDYGIDIERVSPYDAFPSPASTTCDDGDFIQRHRLMRRDLHDMRGQPGFSDTYLEQAIERYGKSGLREITYGETEREWLSGRRTSFMSGEIIEALEYWGGASGSMLLEWGMKGVDPYTEYQINAWMIGEFVIKAIINPHPLGKRPYSKASFANIPGAFWGTCPPEMMRDTQLMCNSSARAITNNMGVASGPQVEVTVDRLPDGEDVTAMHPWKIWQTTSDRTGGGQPAIRFFQPNMNADVLLNVLQYFMRIADEITGIPNYIYGNTQVGGAGRTASGLSMLMENASKGIKQSIVDLDEAVNDVLERIYYHEMVYNPDKTIKGDMKIVPAGVVGAMIKDHINEKRNLFLQSVSNPMDMQIVGLEGRAELLRQIAAGMQIETDKVIPSKEVLAQRAAMGGIPPEVQKELEDLQQQVQDLLVKANDKSEENAIRREEVAARVNAARIAANAMIESRMHENELKSKQDREAKTEAASITAATNRYIADLRAEVDRDKIASQERIEADRNRQDAAQAERDTKSAAESERREQSDAEVRKMYADLAKAITNMPAPVINVQVDAKSGAKKIDIKKDAAGNIIGADVKEQ